MPHIQSQIIGTLIGRIWMPAITCTKEVNIDLNSVKRRTSSLAGVLRYAVTQAVSDGDFRECKFTPDSELIVSCTTRRKNQLVQRTRRIPLSSLPSLADCVEGEQHV